MCLNQFFKPYGITTEQWAVLKRLTYSNNISQIKLARITEKDQATLAKILDLLEKNNLVIRTQNPEDRRSFLICITEKVENLFSRIIEGIPNDKLLNIELGKEK